MQVYFILLIMGVCFLLGGFITAAVATYTQERKMERLAQMKDVKRFMLESRRNPSVAFRIGGLIAMIIGVVCLIAASVVWITS